MTTNVYLPEKSYLEVEFGVYHPFGDGAYRFLGFGVDRFFAVGVDPFFSVGLERLFGVGFEDTKRLPYRIVVASGCELSADGF